MRTRANSGATTAVTKVKACGPHKYDVNIRTAKDRLAVTSITDECDLTVDGSIFEQSKKAFTIIEFGDVDEIKRLFEDGDQDTVCDTMNSAGENLMFPAVRRETQALEVCEYLYTRGVACNFREFERYQSPLSAVITNFHVHKNMGVVDFLLDHQCCVDERDKMQCTPIFLAIRAKHLSIVENFIGRRADANVVDILGDTLLHAAAELGDAPILKYLLGVSDSGNITKRNLKGQVPLNLCVIEKCVRILLGDPCARNDDAASSPMPLIRAVLDDRVYTATALIEYGFNANEQDEQGCTALHYAVSQGNRLMVNFLLRHNANPHLPNNKGVTPLQVVNGSLYIAALTEIDFYASVKTEDLCDIKARIGAATQCRVDGNSLLFAACERARNGDLHSIISYLTKELPDVDVNCLNANGITPLIFACRRDNVRAVDVLLRCGAKMEADCAFGTQNALKVAREWESSRVAAYLQKVVCNERQPLDDIRDRQDVQEVKKDRNAFIGVRSTPKRRGDASSRGGSIMNDDGGSPSHQSERSCAFRGSNENRDHHNHHASPSKTSATKPFSVIVGEDESSISTVSSLHAHPLSVSGSGTGVADLDRDTSPASSRARPLDDEHCGGLVEKKISENVAAVAHLCTLLREHRCWDDILAYIESSNPLLSTVDCPKHKIMFLAAAWNHGSCAVEYFIKRDINIHHVDAAYQTPLFNAVRFGSVDSVRALLHARANPDHLDADGRSPLTYVQEMRPSDHRSTLESLFAEFSATGKDRGMDEEIAKQERPVGNSGDAGNAQLKISSRATSTNPWTEEDEHLFFGMTFADYERTRWNIRLDCINVEMSPSNCLSAHKDSLESNDHVIVTFFDSKDATRVIPYNSRAYKYEFELAEKTVPDFRKIFPYEVNWLEE
eukprot:GEMP01001712.1.p1 GENE.GEMP01001712.1~~GEMP01001712.1.p1  ORF type:complete len:898 (+),score=164.83 GEMP01001712.1:131-2824(+)